MKGPSKGAEKRQRLVRDYLRLPIVDRIKAAARQPNRIPDVGPERGTGRLEREPEPRDPRQVETYPGNGR